MAKEPKDDNYPTRLRWFAKRIADMMWWGEDPKPEQPAPTEPASEEPQATSEGQEPPTGDEQQQTTDDGLLRKVRPRRGRPYPARVIFLQAWVALILARLSVRCLGWRALRRRGGLPFRGAALDFLNPPTPENSFGDMTRSEPVPDYLRVFFVEQFCEAEMASSAALRDAAASRFILSVIS